MENTPPRKRKQRSDKGIKHGPRYKKLIQAGGKKQDVVLGGQLVKAGLSPSLAGRIANVDRRIAIEVAERAEALKTVVDEIKKTLADECYFKAFEALQQVNDEKLKGANLVALSTFAGTMIDKARVMEGKPTEIVAMYKAVIEKYIIQDEERPQE